MSDGITIVGMEDLKAYLVYFPKEADRQYKLAVKNVCKRIMNAWRKNLRVHTDTGELDRSLVVSSDDGYQSGVVSSDVPQAIWIEYGTKPHPISPVKARFLKFFSLKSGSTVFAKKVSHPGTKADPCLLKAWLKVNPEKTLTDDIRNRFEAINK